MTKTEITSIVLICVVFVILLARVSSCQTKQAQNEAKLAQIEAENLKASLNEAEAENARLREILAKTYEALERADKAIEEASRDHEKRLDEIGSVDGSWLQCPLPDGVRSAFCGTDGNH